MKAAIFDLNGVFIQSPPLSKRFADDFGVPAEEFMPVLQASMAAVRKPGAADLFSYWKPHLHAWGISFSAQDFMHYWFSAEKPNEEMIAYMRELKASGWRVIALSNNFRERAEYYAQHFAFLQEFDHIYYSWQTGLVKPDVACWKQILADTGLSPSDCYYFDDSPKNVAAAKSVGMHAFSFEGVEQVKAVLSAVLSAKDLVAFLKHSIETKLPAGGLICLCGPGASGKSTLARALEQALGDAVVYSFDGLFLAREKRRSMRDEHNESLSAAHPKAVRTAEAVDVLRLLRAGSPAPAYGSDHTPDAERVLSFVRPKKYTLVEGIGSLHPPFAELYNYIIFLDISPDAELARRFARDEREKAQSREEIMATFAIRRKQFDQYVEPQKKYADVLVTAVEGGYLLG
jgi:HAD superfamily hydrolase (TIGR01509 family)